MIYPENHWDPGKKTGLDMYSRVLLDLQFPPLRSEGKQVFVWDFCWVDPLGGLPHHIGPNPTQPLKTHRVHVWLWPLALLWAPAVVEVVGQR